MNQSVYAQVFNGEGFEPLEGVPSPDEFVPPIQNKQSNNSLTTQPQVQVGGYGPTNKAPAYSHMARRMGLQGKVVLNVEVLANGSCGQINIAQSSGHTELDNNALSAVKTWHFIPATQAGKAINKWHQVPIIFSLMDTAAGYVTNGGLTWAPITARGTWDMARKTCATSTALGYKWRQPTKDELLVLYAAPHHNSTILPIADSTLSYTWSATNYAFNRHNVVSLYTGSVEYNDDDDGIGNYISCVHENPVL
ncbi:MAG: TonB family protein [Candidatus Nitrotoga sp.]|nr:TonB family protein [Candidatus Nitrotoga sp.]